MSASERGGAGRDNHEPAPTRACGSHRGAGRRGGRRSSRATRKRFRIGVPLGRLGEAQDLANAIAFLASDEAHYISGERLYVDRLQAQC